MLKKKQIYINNHFFIFFTVAYILYFMLVTCVQLLFHFSENKPIEMVNIFILIGLAQYTIFISIDIGKKYIREYIMQSNLFTGHVYKNLVLFELGFPLFGYFISFILTLPVTIIEIWLNKSEGVKFVANINFISFSLIFLISSIKLLMYLSASIFNKMKFIILKQLVLLSLSIYITLKFDWILIEIKTYLTAEIFRNFVSGKFLTSIAFLHHVNLFKANYVFISVLFLLFSLFLFIITKFLYDHLNVIEEKGFHPFHVPLIKPIILGAFIKANGIFNIFFIVGVIALNCIFTIQNHSFFLFLYYGFIMLSIFCVFLAQNFLVYFFGAQIIAKKQSFAMTQFYLFMICLLYVWGLIFGKYYFNVLILLSLCILGGFAILFFYTYTRVFAFLSKLDSLSENMRNLVINLYAYVPTGLAAGLIILNYR